MNNTQSRQKVFYPHLHAFRGFAILNIIAAHAWVVFLMVATQGQLSESDQAFVAISESIFHNATIYFAMISGLLFSLVFKNHTWSAFYRGKFKNVVIPYTIFTIVYVLLMAKVLVTPGTETPPIQEVLLSIPTHWLNGSASGHMWYIPVLLGLFVLTPVLKYLLSQQYSAALLCILLILPLVISRTWPENTWQNYVFFLAPYALGVWCGVHYSAVIAWLNQHNLSMLAVVVITTPVLLYLYLHNVEAFAGISFKESIGYLQKSIISLLMIWLLARNQEKLPKILHVLGSHAFALYFVHMFFIIVWSVVITQLISINLDYVGIVFWGSVVFVSTIITSLLFSMMFKKLLGRYSRPLIGN